MKEGRYEGTLLDVSDEIIEVNMPNIAQIATKSNPKHQRIKLVKMCAAYHDMPVQYYWDTNDEELFDIARRLIGEEMIFEFTFHPDSSGHVSREVDLQEFWKLPAA